jgi:hypothetical protein
VLVGHVSSRRRHQHGEVKDEDAKLRADHVGLA